MDSIGLQYSERMAAEGTLGNTTLNEFQRIVAGLHGWGDIEHHGDGTHGDITADSITTDSATVESLTTTAVVVETATVSTQLLLPDGTASVPGLGFTEDANTGLYRESLPFSRSVVHVAADGVDALAVRASAGNGGQVELPNSPGATGANARGPFFLAGRNASGSGAPGCIGLMDRTGVTRYLFFDSTGVLRQHTSQPTEAGGDLVGSAV